MSTHTKKFRVYYRQNGVGNAFMRELGCDCCQCTKGQSGAQTSGSLIIEEITDQVAKPLGHLLFDFGAGVVDSLIDAKLPMVTHLFNSHNHLDHIADADRLVQSEKRSSRRFWLKSQPQGTDENDWPGDKVRLPLYATDGTFKAGVGRMYGYLPLDSQILASGVPVAPAPYSRLTGERGEAGFGIELKITPVRVFHGNPKVVPEPVIFVIEFRVAEDRPQVKIVLAWDLLCLWPRYAGEDYHHFPGVNVPRANSSVLLAEHQVLANADLLILEANTVQPSPTTGHTCLETGLKFTVPLLSPKKAWFCHYSGHEDRNDPVSDSALLHLMAEASRSNPKLPQTLSLAKSHDFEVWG